MKNLKQTILKVLFLSTFLSAGVPSLFGMQGIPITSLERALEILEETSSEWPDVNSKNQKEFFLKVLERSDKKDFMDTAREILKTCPSYIDQEVLAFVAAKAICKNLWHNDTDIRKKAFRTLIVILQIAAQKAEDNIGDENTASFFKILVKKGKALQIVVPEAESYVENGNIRQMTLDFFSNFVYGSDDSAICIQKLIFLKALVEAGKNYEEATEEARVNICYKNKMVRLVALNLFEALFQQEYQPAFEAALEAISNNFELAHSSELPNHLLDKSNPALHQFNTLVKNIDMVSDEELKQKIFKVATKAACDSYRLSESFAVSDLFRTLYKKGHEEAFEEQMKIAKERANLYILKN